MSRAVPALLQPEISMALFRPFMGVFCVSTLMAPAAAQTIVAADILPETVVVTDERSVNTIPDSESITAAEASDTINAVDTEDMLRYLPSLLVRKRHYGDTQDPIATRTSGVGASAHSLIYADGILLSSPIGNNNSTASPHWGLVAPEDVAAIDVLYGPFAAEYAGGSIGAVVNITTAMPQHFTVYADALFAAQHFDQYATENTYGTWQLAGGIGDRDGAFSWRLSANHLDSTGQPLGYVTLPRSSAPGGSLAITGAFNDRNRSGMPIVEIGANGIEHQVEDTDTLKLAYDFPIGRLAYTASVFRQTDDASAQSYLRDGAGAAVYSGTVDIAGYNYAIPASAFSNGVYDWQQTHLAQGLSFRSTPGAFEWQLIGSDYAYLDDNQHVPSLALPGAAAGGAGSLTRLTGTGWYTLDAKGVWRDGANELSFGLHRDQEIFAQAKFAMQDWISADAGALTSQAKGRTATDAAWLQDIWQFAPRLKAMLGGRLEDWRAYDGFNYSASPALNVLQPKITGHFFSPKAQLAWQPRTDWSLTASYGSAWRMPTVTELYQTITTGTVLTVPNPRLKPEHANSYELAAERKTADGRIRLSLFEEDLNDALISQSAPLLADSSTLYSYVQNIAQVRSRGLEVVAQQAVAPTFELSGTLTFVDSHILKDGAFTAAVGKYTPQIPRWRATAMATWRPQERLALTLAARYSDRSFATIDNSDPVSHTYQGFDSYLVFDVRAHYRLDRDWSIATGIDNLGNDKYYLYHPFPQRTLVMEVHYAQ
jgi:iron complex outermembrane receptor protein